MPTSGILYHLTTFCSHVPVLIYKPYRIKLYPYIHSYRNYPQSQEQYGTKSSLKWNATEKGKYKPET